MTGNTFKWNAQEYHRRSEVLEEEVIGLDGTGSGRDGNTVTDLQSQGNKSVTGDQRTVVLRRSLVASRSLLTLTLPVRVFSRLCFTDYWFILSSIHSYHHLLPNEKKKKGETEKEQ